MEAIIEQGLPQQFSQESFWSKLNKAAKIAVREIVEKSLVLYYVGNDPSTPRWAKGVIAAALGYFILPLDAIPDIAPFVGYADDLGAIAAALATIAACISKTHHHQAKTKTEEWFGYRNR